MTNILHVVSVRPLSNHRLWLRFNDGATKIFDLTPFLGQPAFVPLAEQQEFEKVYIDYGTVCWMDGDIDFSPETMCAEGVPVSGNDIE